MYKELNVNKYKPPYVVVTLSTLRGILLANYLIIQYIRTIKNFFKLVSITAMDMSHDYKERVGMPSRVFYSSTTTTT